MSFLNRDEEHDTSTARGYLLAVLEYLQEDGAWKLSDNEATVDHAISLMKGEWENERGKQGA